MSKNLTRALATVCFTAALTPLMQAQQVGVSNMNITPNNPNGCQPINVVPQGFLPASNYEIGGFGLDIVDFTISLSLQAEQDGVGQPVLTPFSLNELPPLGPFPEGTYTVEVFLTEDGVPFGQVFTTTLEQGPILEPDPGEYGDIEVCNTDAPFPLFSVLGGTPDPGGTWLDPFNLAHPATFTPGVAMEGFYTYIFNQPPPCEVFSEIIYVGYTPNNSAGITVNWVGCTVGAPTDFFSLLGGSPDAGGTWTGPGGSAFDGTFVPGTNTSGIYTYTVQGVPPCGNPSANVIASVLQPANAGSDATGVVCETDTAALLNQFLSPGHSANGNWYDLANFFYGEYNATFDATVGVGETFKYLVGNQGCAPDTALITIEILPEPCDISVEEHAAVGRFDVMPNPTTGPLVLEFEWLVQGERFTLEVVDALGRSLSREELVSSGTLVRHTMDLAPLPRGVYLLSLRSDSGRSLRRVVRE